MPWPSSATTISMASPDWRAVSVTVPARGLPNAARTSGGSTPWATALRRRCKSGSATRSMSALSISVSSPASASETSLCSLRASSRTGCESRANRRPISMRRTRRMRSCSVAEVRRSPSTSSASAADRRRISPSPTTRARASRSRRRRCSRVRSNTSSEAASMSSSMRSTSTRTVCSWPGTVRSTARRSGNGCVAGGGVGSGAGGGTAARASSTSACSSASAASSDSNAASVVVGAERSAISRSSKAWAARATSGNSTEPADPLMVCNVRSSADTVSDSPERVRSCASCSRAASRCSSASSRKKLRSERSSSSSHSVMIARRSSARPGEQRRDVEPLDVVAERLAGGQSRVNTSAARSVPHSSTSSGSSGCTARGGSTTSSTGTICPRSWVTPATGGSASGTGVTQPAAATSRACAVGTASLRPPTSTTMDVGGMATPRRARPAGGSA